MANSSEHKPNKATSQERPQKLTPRGEKDTRKVYEGIIAGAGDKVDAQSWQRLRDRYGASTSGTVEAGGTGPAFRVVPQFEFESSARTFRSDGQPQNCARAWPRLAHQASQLSRRL
jgi:hypothetical protein